MKVPTMADSTFFLSGEYDLLDASELEVSLLHFAHSQGRGLITVDAEELRFFVASCVGVLLRVLKVLEREGRTLRVTNPPEMTRRVLEALNLTEILGVDTVTESRTPHSEGTEIHP
jgi:anti-anti-sigma factor